MIRVLYVYLFYLDQNLQITYIHRSLQSSESIRCSNHTHQKIKKVVFGESNFLNLSLVNLI